MFNKVNILDIKVTNISLKETIQEIEKSIRNNNCITVFTVNVDFIIKSKTDSFFKQILNSSQLSIPDGKPLIWASKFLNNPLKEKVAGSDVFFKFCVVAASKGYRLFFLGAEKGIAKRAAEILSKKYKNLEIVGTYSPPYGFENDEEENERIINIIRTAKPDVLFVGLGTPKQEKWIYKYREKYNVPTSIGVGGTLDFAAGIKSMPPKWTKRIGLAWFWRLMHEPKRLWKRILVEDMKFFYYVFLQKITNRFD